MKNYKILTVATFSLILLSGCSNGLPQEQVPLSNGLLSSSAASAPSSTGSVSMPSSSATTSSSSKTPSAPVYLPGVVDNPAQRNQKLVPHPAKGTVTSPVGVGGSGKIIDGVRDSLGAGSKEDKRQAAESYLSFVNLVNKKDYASACEYVKLKASQGTDCLAAMDKVDIASRIYPTGLKIDRLDNGVIKGDMATLNKLVFVYDGDKRLSDVYMFKPTDGSGKWKIVL